MSALFATGWLRKAYDATVALALAAQAAGRLDGAAIRDRLRAVGSPPGAVVTAGPSGVADALRILAGGGEVDYEGASGSMDWDANGDLRRGHIGVWRFTEGRADRRGPGRWRSRNRIAGFPRHQRIGFVAAARSAYVFGQRVTERISATSDVAEPPVQPGWFKTLIFIYSNFHPVDRNGKPVSSGMEQPGGYNKVVPIRCLKKENLEFSNEKSPPIH